MVFVPLRVEVRLIVFGFFCRLVSRSLLSLISFNLIRPIDLK